MSPGAAGSQPQGGINSCSFDDIGVAKLKMNFQTKRKFRRVGGVHDYGILRAWGGNAFWNFRRQGGGLKHGSRPWLGMDIFWNCPISPFSHKMCSFKKDQPTENSTANFMLTMTKIVQQPEVEQVLM